MAAQKKRSTTSKSKPATKTQGKTQTRKSASGNKSNKGKQAESKAVSRDSVIINDIKIILGFVIVVLLELSNFSLVGKFGDIISRFMFGLFGLFAYIVPVLIFIGVGFFMANVSSRSAMKKLIASVIMFVMLCTFLQLIFAGTDYGTNFGQIYRESANAKNGGGLTGGLVAAALYSTIGIFGAYIVVVAVFMITIVIISEKSIVTGFKNGSRYVYDSAKDDIRRMKDNSAERIARKEQNKLERAKKTVRGVNLNSKITNENQEDANIHELVNNGSLYRGPIDDKHFTDSAKDTSDDIFDSRVERNTQNISDVHITDKHISVKNVESNSNEDGEFKPKEQIQVSKAAKEVMNRKAFSGTSLAKSSNDIKDIPNDRAVPNVNVNNSMASGTHGEIKGVKSGNYIMPPLDLLVKGNINKRNSDRRGKGISETAAKLQETLNAFGVKASVVNESRGPSVTRYELQPETGTKVSKITSLADDIKLNLAASDIRIEAPIPGKAAVGIEVPNHERESVFLRDLIESQELSKHPSKLAFAAGMDIAGKVVVADIAKMPHMLIAGTTGSGKSVFTNSIIMSILFRANPDEVKLIIVDPKVVEFGVYNGIPHLLTPVVTDPKKAAGSLNWAVAEMSRRYQEFAKYNVRDLKGYNEKIKGMGYKDGEDTLIPMPQIVIIIDELADLMMVASKEVESAICRLAQLARAAGIHLIIATQRPSVDVVTGLIKANIPSRVALLVSSGTDSRTIIDCNGGEKLLGNGDMLFYPSGYVKPVRLQGAFVSDAEVQKVVKFLIDNNKDVEYDEEVTNAELVVSSSDSNSQDNADGNDVLFEEAARFVIEKEKGSTSMLQRMFKIGFNRASRIVDQLEKAGIVGPDEGTKPRKVLMTMEEFDKIMS